MDFDLDNFTPADTPEEMRLTNPATGDDLARDGKPVVLLVWGPDSPRMRTFERTIQDKRLKAAQNTGRMNLTARAVEAEVAARAAHAVAGWRNLSQGGHDLPYSEEAARQLMHRFYWIRDQVSAFYQNRGNFLTGRDGASSTTPPEPVSS